MKSKCVALAVLLIFAASATCYADKQPQAAVQFDVTAIVGFSESTTAEFTTAHTREKTVRAELVVSMFVPPQIEVTNALYHFYFLEGGARIADYAPRTRVLTDVVGEIDVANSAEDKKHVSVSGGAHFDDWISADAGGGRNQSSATTTTYKVLPPVATVVAAGTSNRQQGVYFKLQQTPIETLEGEQRIEIALRVPETWRGGYMRMVAQASNSRTTYAASSFLVPVYLQGDVEAQQVATQLLTFERYLLQAAQTHAADVHRAGRPTVVHEMALRAPEIPADWQHQLLWRHVGSRSPEFAPLLPSRVRSAAANFHTAKRLAVALSN